MTLKPVNCINSALVIRNDYCGAIFLIKILIKIVAVLSLSFRGEGNQCQNGNFWINFKYRCNRITKVKKETSHRHQNITDEDCFKNANCTIISWNRIGFSRAQNVDHIGRCLLAPHFDRNNA